MRVLKAFWGLGLAAALAIRLLCSTTAGAMSAGGTALCSRDAANQPTLTPTAGACSAGYKLTELGAEGTEGKEGKLSGLSEAEIKTLDEVLPYMKFIKEGVDKKPTIQFSGANLQVIDGSKSETAVNGTGNLIIGYDEGTGTQTGSHNLLLGTSNSYTSYGGIVGGDGNKISSSYASILGGAANTATGFASTIVGGYTNKASTS